MNFTINQTNGIRETVNSEFINKLYNLFITNRSSHTINLSGYLYSPTGYKALMDALNSLYGPDLVIEIPVVGLYILIEDLNVLQILLDNNISSDGIGISATDAANATFTSNTFLNNTNIRSFPEFNLFTKANANPPDNLFYGCSNLASIDLSEVTKTSAGEFRGSGITTVNAPNLQNMSEDGYDFAECTNLTTVQSLGSITKISKAAFYDCSSLLSVNVPNICTLVDMYAFKLCSALECSINTLLPQNVISIGKEAFNEANSIYGIIDFPNLTSIGIWTFRNTLISGIDRLGEITQIPALFILTNNNNYAKLLYAHLPYSCTSIGESAFQGQSILTTVDQYDNDAETPTFTSLSKITNFDKKCFLNCSQLLLTQSDVAGAVTIGEQAFTNCTLCFSGNLNLPNIETIGPQGFANTGITSLTLGSSLRSIDANAFNNCAIEKIIIPEGCVTVSAGQYKTKNKALRYWEFPSTVTNIGNFFHRAFEQSDQDSIYIIIKATTPPTLVSHLNNSSYTDTSKVAGIYVPDASLIAYQSATGEWTNSVILNKLKRISLLLTDSLTWWNEYLTRVNSQ